MKSTHQSFIRLLLLATLMVMFFLLNSCGGSSYFRTSIPSVISFSPTNGQTNVSRSPSIQFQFNKAVTNVNPTTVHLYENCQTNSPVATTSIIQVTMLTYAFSPVNTLSSNTTYCVVLSNEIKDVLNNSLARTTSSFTTGDFIAPTVSLISPANNSTNASLSPSIQIKFSEKVNNVNSSTVTLLQGSATGHVVAIGAIVASSTNTYTFSPVANLNPNTTYYIVFNKGITDLSGNALIAPTLNFTTVIYSIPTATMLTPSNNDTGVSFLPSIQIKFSETVIGVSSSTVTMYQSSITGTPVEIGTITPSANNVYSFSPTTNLTPSTTYYIVLSNGITDPVGEALATTIFHFTTGFIAWTWQSGITGVNQLGIYGTQGVANSKNVPGGRTTFVSWTDSAGHLWLFGGYGFGNTATVGILNDLWEYNISSSNWTWVSGSSMTNQLGVYGTQSVASPSNVPGSRASSVSWTDTSGNFWLFGGFGYDSTGAIGSLNDLWKYNIDSGNWTWVSGSSISNQLGVYGTQGISSPSNIPGARGNSVSWTDASGNLWLFGGLGYDSTGATGHLNDLWKYNISSANWTWVSGSSTANQLGVYGTQGVASPSNIPGARGNSVSWTDASGNFWLFGGFGYDSTGAIGSLNDLWKYNIGSGNWTWVSGSSISNQLGVYGTQGISSPSNVPGGRASSVSWTDSAGNLWLFGGNGYDSTGAIGFLSDLWEYNVSVGNWTWVSGSSAINQSGTYGTQGIASSLNMPGNRYGSLGWIDSTGHLWLFGGANGSGYLNDLWSYGISG